MSNVRLSTRLSVLRNDMTGMGGKKFRPSRAGVSPLPRRPFLPNVELNRILLMSSSGTDLASLEVQLSLSRAALADRIFANLGSSSGAPTAGSSSSSSTKPSSPARPKGQSKAAHRQTSDSNAPFQHRPPTLGLGAKPATPEAGQVAKLSVEDARLKGRLGKSNAQDKAVVKGKRKLVDDARDERDGHDDAGEDEEEEVSKISSKGKAQKAARPDPFAAKPKKVTQPQTASNLDAATRPESTQPRNVDISATLRSDEGDTSLASLNGDTPNGKLSKSQRKKLNKKRRLEEAASDADLSTHTKAASQGDSTKPLASAPESSDDRKAEVATPALASHTISYKPSAALRAEPASSLASSALSEHQRSLHAKLLGSHFRQLNESLYTSASADSFQRAQDEPTRMQAYHDGFREQVKKWPQKPYELIGNCIVDGVLAHWYQITSGASTAGTSKGSAAKGGAQRGDSIPAGCLVADLGAGEGPLARYLAQHPKLRNASPALPPSLRPRVLAYDLLDTEDGIVRGVDCAQPCGLPLPGPREAAAGAAADNTDEEGPAVVDVAVFCLSLMGTDWVRMVAEARRVLRPKGGQLIIAEVSSRLPSADDKKAFARLIEKLGFKQIGVGEQQAAEKSNSNTHFFMLRFSTQRRSESVNEDAIAALVSEGQKILQPCLYKRR